MNTKLIPLIIIGIVVVIIIFIIVIALTVPRPNKTPAAQTPAKTPDDQPPAQPPAQPPDAQPPTQTTPTQPTQPTPTQPTQPAQPTQTTPAPQITMPELIRYATNLYNPPNSERSAFLIFLENLKLSTRAQDEEKIKKIENFVPSTGIYSQYDPSPEYNRACINILKKKLAEYTYPS